MSEFDIMSHKKRSLKQPPKYRQFIEDLYKLGELIREFITENLRNSRGKRK